MFGGVGLLAWMAVAGMFLRREPYPWMLAAALIGVSASYIVTHVEVRYIYPVFGIGTLLSFDFLLRLMERRRWPHL